MHQLNDYRMLRFARSNVKKISFRFTLEIDLEKTLETLEWRRHVALSTSHRYYSHCIKIMTSCRRRLD